MLDSSCNNTDKKCGFKEEHYREMLLTAKKNYAPNFFGELPAGGKKRIYLRHDIDYSPNLALKMARLENRIGFAATYFILPDCFYYNPFNPENIEIIKQIRSLGHAVGLHFDHKSAEQSGRTVKEEIKIQLEMCRRYFPIDDVASAHRPPAGFAGRDFDLGQGIINAYGPVFCDLDRREGNRAVYFSDSACNWREGCVCGILEAGKYQNIQLLIHPVWWMDSLGEINKTLCKFWEDEKKLFDRYALKEKIRGYVGGGHMQKQ